MKGRPPFRSVGSWILFGVGALIIGLSVLAGPPSGGEFVTFLILAFLVGITVYFTSAPQESPIPRLAADVIFMFAGAILVPPLFYVLLTLVPPAMVLARRGITAPDGEADSRSQGFHLGVRVLTGLAVGALIRLLQPGDFLTWSVGLTSAVAVFLVFHQGLYLARQISRTTSRGEILIGINKEDVVRDLFVLVVGAGLAAVWIMNAWLVIPLLLELLLIYRVAQIPTLEKQAQTDVKTGLWNARYLEALLPAELERASRFGRPLAVMMADLDWMRHINNRYGHLAGDAVLSGIGEVIRRSLREYDIAGRFGGEEFVIVLPETGVEEAAAIAERIRATVDAEEFHVTTSPNPIHATMSFGVASFPVHGQTADDLLHAADVAVYSAKGHGRNRVAVAMEPVSGPASLPSRTEAATAPSSPRPIDASLILTFLLGNHFGLLLKHSRAMIAFVPTAILLLCSLASGAAGIIAAERALPGDALYPAKSMMENIQLSFASDEASRASVLIDLGQSRVVEASALADIGRFELIPATVAAYSRTVEQASRLLMSLRLSDPTRANALMNRAKLEWSEASSILISLRNRVPAGIDPSIVSALAVSQSQTAQLEEQLAQSVAQLQPAQPTLSASPLPVPTPTDEAVAVTELERPTPHSVAPPDLDIAINMPSPPMTATPTPSTPSTLVPAPSGGELVLAHENAPAAPANSAGGTIQNTPLTWNVLPPISQNPVADQTGSDEQSLLSSSGSTGSTPVSNPTQPSNGGPTGPKKTSPAPHGPKDPKNPK